MADTKITALTAISTVDPAIDVLPIVDVSDTTMAASGTTKKITSNQILGAGGTATLASATITGDLTVDTSTLKVDSANNRVGIGTASPTVALDVVGASAISGTVSVGTTTPLATGSGRGNVTVNGSTDAILAFGIAGVNSGFVLQDSAGMTLLSSGATYLRCYTNGSERYKIDSTGVATWSNVGGVAGTAMTLNSTGLGVGGSPSYKLDVAASAVRVKSAAAYSALLLSSDDANAGTRNWATATNFNNYGDFCIVQSNAIGGNPITAGTVRVNIDTSGNVGVGVTPSAWSGSFKAIDIASGCLVSQPANQTVGIFANAFGNGTNYTRKATGLAAAYDIFNGAHYWLNAPTGIAGTTFSFGTAAMTLDASGNLLVGKTAGYGTGESNTLQLKSFLVFAPDDTGSASNRNWLNGANGSAAGSLDWTVSSANNNWPNFAYRMQLTSAGALNNTTGTYGTISDLRLKENISDARNYLADLLKLRVVKYSLKEESSAVATKLGFIAQEVEQVFPNLVDQSDVAYDGGEGIRSVKTSILIPMLLKAIQELTARVEALEA